MYLKQFSTPSSLSQVPVSTWGQRRGCSCHRGTGGGEAQGTPSSCSASHWGHSALGWRGEEQGRWAANPHHACRTDGLNEGTEGRGGGCSQGWGRFPAPTLPPRLPGDPSHASPGFGWDPRESSGGFLLSRLAAAGKETAAPKGLKFKQKKNIYI